MPDQPHAMGLLARASAGVSVERAASIVQRAIQGSSARRVFARTRPYQDLIDPQLRTWRLGAVVFSAFSALALCIAAVGLFGVVSFVVTQRTREMGIRLAMGGRRDAVARLVVYDSVRMVLVGLALGNAAALAAGPFIASMLFDTSPREPASMSIAATVLLATTIAASAWPAWRAARVDPLVALRAE